jgi:hypothetical protein
MKPLKSFVTLLLLSISVVASAAITSGYYRIKSSVYDNHYITENTNNHTLVTSALAADNYAQVWYLSVSGSSVSIKNVLSDRYVNATSNYSVIYPTGTSSRSFTYAESSGAYTFAEGSGYGLHCAATQSYTVVRWYTNSDASVWQIESAAVNQDALAAQKAAFTEVSSEKLLNYFTTTACTQLNSAQSSYSDDLLISTMRNDVPQSVIDMALKVKNDTWATYNGWDKTERTFRIADYKAYSSSDQWTGVMGWGHKMGRLSNPTGIYVESGDFLQVYVGPIPSGQSVKLEVAGFGAASGDQYSLHQGMNVLQAASAGNCLIYYEVDNTTNGKAPFTLMSNYADVTVHIEGGTVQGYFDLTKGDDDSDWTHMKMHLMSKETVCLKSSKHVMNLYKEWLFTALGTSSVVDMMNVWKNLSEWEDELIGFTDTQGQTTYGQYCNNVTSVTSLPGTGSPHATNYGTYYYDYSHNLIFNANALMTVADNMWCIAHEQGHNRQAPINMVGNTEVSNNLFSNMAIYKQGRYTSRTASLQEVFRDFQNGVSWPERVAKSCDSYGNYNQQLLHLNWSLYLYFHVLGKDPDFFPRLFDALRADPLVKVKSGNPDNSTLTPADTDYLKYYVKCCQISGCDLTEFFAAFGFFMIPPERDYSITYNGYTTNRFQTINDYGYYYLYVTQNMIDNAKNQVKNMNLPKSNIIFIEDRVTAPDAIYEGHASGEKRTINPDAPVTYFGQVGETGQYTEFNVTCSAYKYNVQSGVVTMVGTGAVGFKVYDSTGELRGVYNTYKFTLPDGIGANYIIKAAAGNGSDVAATFDESIGIIESDVNDVPSAGAQITAENQLISGKLYLLRNTATGNPWISDEGTYYSVPDGGGTLDERCMYYLIKDGNAWKIKNFVTGKYWGKPTAASTTDQGGFVPADEADAGSWSLNFNSNNNIDPQCNGFYINRSSQKLHAWTSSLSSQIYEVTLTYPPFSDFTDKDISISKEAANTLQTGQWYVMFDRGANHGFLYENDKNQLYNTATIPSGSATDNAKYLVRIIGWNNEYYIQTGLGNFFGKIQGSTTVPTTATAAERIILRKIASTDGHYYLTSAEGVVLDANNLSAGDANVVGYGTTIPTSTGGNNDWAFYPVEFVESWSPTITEVYTINNTNANRGALTYEPSKSTTYVWSSGKSGATAFDASIANHQWVIIPIGTTEQFYLYNVGAGKFAVPVTGGTFNGYCWSFSPNAVAIRLVLQDDGTYKLFSVTGDVIMSVSNNYDGPIINYNDIGGNFTITKVDGDQSAAATAALNKLVDNKTAASAVPASGSDGWYIIRIKTHGTYADKYVFPAASEINYNGTYYPLTFDHGANVRPAIDDVTYYTRISNESGNYYWQMPNGKYLYGNSNKFPISTMSKSNFAMDYTNGRGFRMWGSSRYAVPYLLSSQYFIGETSNSGNAYYDIYPINLSEAGIAAWQVLCDDAPDNAQITCSRSDVKGLKAVYKDGFFFLPDNVTPEDTDFTLEGANGVEIDATAHTVALAYDPNLAMVEGSVAVEQGWQTAGRDSEVMLLRVTAKPFKATTNTTMTVSLKNGSETNISALKLYEADSSSPEIYSTGNGAPTKTVVATATISGSTATFNIGNLAAGTHYYWIGATVNSTATLGAVIDAAVTGISYQVVGQTAQNLDLTSVGDSADRGAMVFNAQSYPFLPRDNGSRVYRIPAMVVADDGSIVVAADKRYESYTDIGGGHVIDIVVRRSTDGGKTWSEPITIAKGVGTADNNRCGFGDPSLVKGKDGKLYCLFAAGNLGYFYGQKHVCMSTSTDNGVTWSSSESNPPVDLYSTGAIQNATGVGAAGGYGLYDYFVTSGKGLYTSDGILMYLIPAQTLTASNYTIADGTYWGAAADDYLFYSTDDGATWYFSQTPMIIGGDEAKVIEMNDGSLFGSIRKGGPRRFNTATYTKNGDGTLSFNYGTQWDNDQLHQDSQNNQDILYYQRETTEGKTDVIIHSITTGNHVNFKLYYSTDQGANWTEFLNVQTKGTRYVTMDKNPANGSLYLLFEDQSLNSAGGYTDYNHYPLNFIEITRDQLVQLIPELEKSADEKEVKIVYGLNGETTYGNIDGNTWTSNANSGVEGFTLTKSDGTYDKFSNWNGHYNLAYKPASANVASTFTLTAPEGYLIKSYSLLTAKASSAEHTYTIIAGGTEYTPAFSSSVNGYTEISIANVNAQSTSLSITTTDVSKWLAIADFVVTIVPQTALLGDVNNDGQVTIADVTALVNIILGKNVDEYGRADVNNDGFVTIADVTALVNIILGK